MDEYTIKFTYPVVSKKNSRVIIKRQGRFITIPNSKWQTMKRRLKRAIGPKYPTFKRPVSIEMMFYLPDKRPRDVDNMATSVLDVLENVGVLFSDRLVFELIARKAINPSKGEWLTVIKIKPYEHAKGN